MTDFGATNVEKSYGDVQALSGVSVEFDTGAVHCLAGPNGSGKSTLFRLLLGLSRPDSGTVTRPETALVGAGFQEPAFYDSLTVAENVATFGRLSGTPGQQWVEEVIDVFELEQMWTRQAGDLSGGFGKQLDLALALLKRPTYLLLDEPLADLDDLSAGRLLSFLAEYAAAGNGVVLSSHRIEEIGSVVDRLTVLRDGSVIRRAEETSADETVAEIYRDAVDRS